MGIPGAGFPVTCGVLAVGQPASAGGAEVTDLQAALGRALWPSASQQNRGEFGVLMGPWPLMYHCCQKKATMVHIVAFFWYLRYFYGTYSLN